MAALGSRWSVCRRLQTAADDSAEDCADRGRGVPAVTVDDLTADGGPDNRAAERAQNGIMDGFRIGGRPAVVSRFAGVGRLALVHGAFVDHALLDVYRSYDDDLAHHRSLDEHRALDDHRPLDNDFAHDRPFDDDLA